MFAVLQYSIEHLLFFDNHNLPYVKPVIYLFMFWWVNTTMEMLLKCVHHHVLATAEWRRLSLRDASWRIDIWLNFTFRCIKCDHKRSFGSRRRVEIHPKSDRGLSKVGFFPPRQDSIAFGEDLGLQYLGEGSDHSLRFTRSMYMIFVFQWSQSYHICLQAVTVKC